MNHLSKLSIVLASISVSMAAWAIPARIGTFEHHQPDGTIIKIKMVGNGNLHFVTTEDGSLLTQDENGFYQLARINEIGRIESVGVKPGDAIADHLHVTHVGDPEFKKLVATRAEDLEENAGPEQWGMGKYRNKYPTVGSPRVPVFLVEFEEQKFADFYDPVDYYNKLLNGDGTEEGDKGSIRNYFEIQSKGKFCPIFDVYGPVLMPNPMTYYGANYNQGWDVNARFMVTDAATLLDDEVDFTPYDQDDDGKVDFVYIIYAGFGEQRQGGEDTIWPHAGDLERMGTFKKVDDLWLKNYACSNELIDETTPEGINTFIHEYSHIIGLPDVYTVDVSQDPIDFTPGPYSIMDYGVYNDNGLTPPNYSAYERNALKWDEPILLDKPMSVALDEISSGQFGLIKTPVTEEFFLIENRQPVGGDAYLPGHGLLIWHIDFQESKFTNNIVNRDPSHLYVDVVRANNETSFISMADGYTFPGTTGKTAFTPETDPAMVTWKGKPVDYPITNIVEKDGIVYFDVLGGDEGGVTGVTEDVDGHYVVCNINGLKVMDTTDKSYLLSLPKGIYIINGKKAVITGASR